MRTILVDGGRCAGRSYRAGDHMAMWLVDIGIIQFYDGEGNMLQTINLLRELELDRMAASGSIFVGCVKRTTARQWCVSRTLRLQTSTAWPRRIPSCTMTISSLQPGGEWFEAQLCNRDITDPRVLEIMGRVPRERFVPPDLRHQAYQDHPLSIGYGQTISQPYIVALMTQLARPTAESRALDVGVGSGYQAAILAEMCHQVYGIEILEPLANDARKLLAALGYQNIEIRCGDAYGGWPDGAAVRRHPVRRRPRRSPSAAGRAACQRRPAGDSRRPLQPGAPADRKAARRHHRPDGRCAGAVRPMTGAAEGPQPFEP